MKKPTILVAEDDSSIRKLIYNLLKDNYEVLLTADGLEAKECYERHAERIEAVLTDVQMPGLNGAQLAEWLRQRGRPVTIILMSGDTGEVEVEHLLRQERVTWLHKPFRIEELENALKTSLDRSELLDGGQIKSSVERGNHT